MAIKRTFFLDDNNDLTILGGGFRLTDTKRDYVGTTVKAKCETFLGEWYRDRGIGFPWFEDVLRADADFNNIETLLTAEVLSVDYVLDVVSYEYEFNNETEVFSAELVLLVEPEEPGDEPQTVTVPITSGE